MIVLDCSAAVHIVRKTPQGNALRSLIGQGEKVISSELFPIEASSAFSRYVRAAAMSTTEALALLTNAVALVDEFVPIRECYIEAFHESLRLEHSVYDMLYAVLARRKQATLVTLDAKLLKLCDEQGIDCIAEVSL